MTTKEFITTLKTFIDPGISIDREGNRMVFSVNGQTNDITISVQDEETFVTTNDGIKLSGRTWILKNLVHLDLLATRIRDIVKKQESYVPPSIQLDLHEQSIGHCDDPVRTIEEYVEKRSFLDTNILYIVSDAGQGKTTLLSEVASNQAKRYIEKKADWLLVPISLGGRTFLRFDDVTVGVLQNTFRFPYLYYDSFLQLIKMGVIVPAYDGFEEMFVENSSDDAFSAVKNLVSSLDSEGAIIIAARKAYFDFEDKKLGEQIIDNINDYSILTDKLTIEKWDKQHFIDYAKKRGKKNGAELYDHISKIISPNHPILTRPIFVKKLFDICNSNENEMDFISKVQTTSSNVIKTFISTIIERENYEKWLDKTGSDNIGRPLLTIVQHYDLLSEIAQFMWDNRKDSLNTETMEFLARYYSDKAQLANEASVQVSKRLLSHALIIKNDGYYSFEHDSFRFFFLGYKIFNLMMDVSTEKSTVAELKSVLCRGLLPIEAIHAILENFKEVDNKSSSTIITKMLLLYHSYSSLPYIQENISNIVIRLSSGLNFKNKFSDMTFSTNALRGRLLSNITFNHCSFMTTSFEGLTLEKCCFENSTFEQIKFPEASSFMNNDSFFQNCKVRSLNYKNKYYWDPKEIDNLLSFFKLVDGNKLLPIYDDMESDVRLTYLQKIGNYLLRSTNLSESWLQLKFGTNFPDFSNLVLPELLQIGLMQQIQNHGNGIQKRYKLTIPLNDYSSVLENSSSYDLFMEKISQYIEKNN